MEVVLVILKVIKYLERRRENVKVSPDIQDAYTGQADLLDGGVLLQRHSVVAIAQLCVRLFRQVQ